ncbi:LysR substrate-binding domain-containing protein [Photobacterium sp. ZSDE20]|uniref:LysR substrate-binding domain-containing protein n=1 Tax=Photobacterium pectinilyticum TaxID=2906793 RepID=A0ABT1MZW0_9GAMM|nr:LysR family transcriptional regulator [Photobacterium sp. ZSDE20]MCQ1058041.1 LysR substrate-binding domain-containing protein [Photobacterium sp. ZSDE20]MDD1822574.1 LysR substrate-binding domain-containing protein [Photobacterium sp. ZSDE20]
MDRLTSIEIFVRAVELGSFAAVAEERGISAQMVGKHVRGLESAIGAKLLTKSTRFQSLTAAGEQYYQRCLIVLAELKAAQEDIYRNMSEPTGSLKIAAGVNFGIKALAPILAQFQQQYPKLEIDLTLENSPPDMKKEGYDVIFREQLEGYDYLVATKLCSYPIIACASPAYLQQYGTPQHPDELDRHQCLQSNLSQDPLKWRFFDGQKISAPKVTSRITMNSGQARLAAALEGAGITLQPIFQVSDALAEGSILPILQDYSLPAIDLYMLYQPSLRNTARLTALQAFVCQALAPHTDD